MERRSDTTESSEIRPIAQRDVNDTQENEPKSMGEKMKDAFKSMIPDALKKNDENGKFCHV